MSVPSRSLRENRPGAGPAPPPEPTPSPIFLEKLLLGRKLIIAGHLNPDGDSVGSSLALALALRNMGREVSISLNGIVSGSLDSLTRPKRLFKEVGYKELQDYDRLILVDCQSPYRVWPDSASPGDAPPIPLVAVDHHQTGQDPALYEAAFIDPAASATAELIFKVLKRLETDFTPAIIEALLAGLISDTGSFSQGNTTAECLRQASELVSMGGDIERVNQAIKQNYRLSRMRLMTKSLASLRVHHGGRMATMMVTDEMLDEAKSDLSETEGLVEYTLLLAGVRLGALIKVTGRGRTRVSLRSRPGIDVRDLARRLGGGGHQQAAAYLDDSPDPEAALRRLLSEAANLFDGISS